MAIRRTRTNLTADFQWYHLPVYGLSLPEFTTQRFRVPFGLSLLAQEPARSHIQQRSSGYIQGEYIRHASTESGHVRSGSRRILGLFDFPGDVIGDDDIGYGRDEEEGWAMAWTLVVRLENF